MKKPQDSDIFGTKTSSFAPRIINNQHTDPNSQFQARMDAQYDAYSKKIGTSQKGIFTTERVQPTRVNQQADFDENYHKFRKDADMQSTIFYEPSISNSRVTERSRITQRFVPKHAYNVQDLEYNFGKKQTLNRETKALPENVSQFKGNSSTIFGYDEHADRNNVKNKVDKLIPHQMQWTDHDSVRHQDLENAKENQSQICISEPASQVFNREDQLVQNLKELRINGQTQAKQNETKNINMKIKQVKVNPEQKTKESEKSKPVQSNKVQISILKGWNSNLMQELSKFCRLNATKILSINFEDGGKGNLTLDRSKRWECITDWLRKDAKLKIRVLN